MEGAFGEKASERKKKDKMRGMTQLDANSKRVRLCTSLQLLLPLLLFSSFAAALVVNRLGTSSGRDALATDASRFLLNPLLQPGFNERKKAGGASAGEKLGCILTQVSRDT